MSEKCVLLQIFAKFSGICQKIYKCREAYRLFLFVSDTKKPHFRVASGVKIIFHFNDLCVGYVYLSASVISLLGVQGTPTATTFAGISP